MRWQTTTPSNQPQEGKSRYALPSRVWIGENITAVTDEILAAMFSGEMTPEEAAEEYAGRISIIYFE